MKHIFYRHASGQRHHVNMSVRFYFDGKPYYAVVGDNVASALLANNITSSGYGYKYERPATVGHYGIYNGYVSVCSDKSLPYVHMPASQVKISEDLIVMPYHKPSWLGFLKKLSFKSFFSKNKSAQGLDAVYHRDDIYLATMSKHSDVIKSFPDLRQNYEKTYCHTDIHIVGGGLYGLYAAYLCALSGQRVIISDKKPSLKPLHHDDLYHELYDVVSSHPKVKILNSVTVLPIHKNQDICAIGCEDFVDLKSLSNMHTPIYTIKSRATILAAGLKEFGFLYQGCDNPCIFTPESYGEYYNQFGLAVQGKIILYVNNDRAYRLLKQGYFSSKANVTIIDSRSELSDCANDAQKSGYNVIISTHIISVQGKYNIESVNIAGHGEQPLSQQSLECDVIIHCAGYQTDLNIYPHFLSDMCMNTHQDYKNIHFKESKIQNNIYAVSYAAGAVSEYECSVQTYNTVKDCLASLNVPIGSNDILSEKMLQTNDLSDYRHDYYGDKKSLEKVFFPADIRLSDFRDAVLRKNDIHILIDDYLDKKLLASDQQSLWTMITLIANEHNMSDDDILKIFFEACDAVYTHSMRKKISDIAGNMNVIARLYSPIYSVYKKYNMILTTDNRSMQPVGLDNDMNNVKSIQTLYDTVKNNFGIRDISLSTDIYRLCGQDAVIFLETILSASVADIVLYTARPFQIQYGDKNITLCVIYHSKNNYFIYLLCQDKTALHDFIHQNFDGINDLKYSVCNMTQQYGCLQILGKNAFEMAGLMNVIFNHNVQNNNDYDVAVSWYENIEMMCISNPLYGLDNVICFMPSDAMSMMIKRLFSSQDDVKNHLFSQNLIDILSLETGHLGAYYDNNISDYKTDIMVIPLSQKDSFICGDLLYENITDANPVGKIIILCYSPHHQKILAYAVIKGDLHLWENRILHVRSHKKYFNIKILSPDYLAKKDIAYA